jgi:hypothetical protein
MEKSLALLACQERRADSLKFCLDQGDFPIEATLEEEAEGVDADKDPETFNVLQRSEDFQELRAIDEQHKARPGRRCPFDKGGALPVDW